MFNDKSGILNYYCDLLIQDIQEYYIPNRIIFILKSCIEVYKNCSDNSQFNNYLEEVKKEIENLKGQNIEDLKLNWEKEFELIKNDISNNSDYIISLFILKFRQSDESDIEYREFLVEMIINNNELFINSHSFFIF